MARTSESVHFPAVMADHITDEIKSSASAPPPRAARQGQFAQLAGIAARIVKNPLAPGHLPFLFTGAGMALVGFLAINGALKSPKTMIATAPQQSQIAQPRQVNRPPPGVVVEEITTAPASQLPAATEQLQKRIKELEEQLESMRTQLEALRAGGQSISRRVTSLESRARTVTGSIDRNATLLPQTTATPPLQRTDRRIPELAPASPQPSPGAPSAPENVSDFTQTQFAVYLAASTNRAALNKRWGELSGKYAKLFKGIEMHIAEPDQGEPGFRLIAGPIRNIAKAAEICVTLKIDGHFCHQQTFPATLSAKK